MFTELRVAAGRRRLTKGEAIASAILGTLFTLLIMAELLDDYTPRNLSVPLFLLFWIPLLAIHELGHALMAKMLGWKVHEIVIGFGPTIWQTRIGETKLVVKLAPVEGYVLPTPIQMRNLRRNSAMIYAAGPGAELMLLGILIVVFGWDGIFGNSEAIGHIALKSCAVAILLGAGFNLVPFKTQGGVSDGLGIISSPFLSQESIELRLLSGELQSIRRRIDDGESQLALTATQRLNERFPNNEPLQLLHVQTLAAADQLEEARRISQEKIQSDAQLDHNRQRWLHQQAKIELNADKPSYLVLDLALQKGLAVSPRSAELLATKGASLVLRGRIEEGGNMLADAWRRHNGTNDDAKMLAYLTIAAYRIGDRSAFNHFQHVFTQINRSNALLKRVKLLTNS